eukprot:6456444-Alexandrium_andersonii.AAC.1
MRPHLAWSDCEIQSTLSLGASNGGGAAMPCARCRCRARAWGALEGQATPIGVLPRRAVHGH